MALFGNIGEQISGLASSTLEQGLATAIPGYAGVKDFLGKRAVKSRGKDYAQLDYKDKKKLADKARKEIKREINGSLNPIRWAINLVKMIFSTSRNDRITKEIQDLKNIASEPYAFETASEDIRKFISLTQKQVRSKQGLLSKLGITTSKKAMEDPVVRELKDATKAWLQPFRELLSGAVPNVRFGEYEARVLKRAAAQLSSSPYTRDIAGQFQQVLNDYHSQQQQRSAATQAQANPNTNQLHAA